MSSDYFSLNQKLNFSGSWRTQNSNKDRKKKIIFYKMHKFWHSLYFLGGHGTSETYSWLRTPILAFCLDSVKGKKNCGQDLRP